MMKIILAIFLWGFVYSLTSCKKNLKDDILTNKTDTVYYPLIIKDTLRQSYHDTVRYFVISTDTLIKITGDTIRLHDTIFITKVRVDTIVRTYTDTVNISILKHDTIYTVKNFHDTVFTDRNHYYYDTVIKYVDRYHDVMVYDTVRIKIHDTIISVSQVTIHDTLYKYSMYEDTDDQNPNAQPNKVQINRNVLDSAKGSRFLSISMGRQLTPDPTYQGQGWESWTFVPYSATYGSGRYNFIDIRQGMHVVLTIQVHQHRQLGDDQQKSIGAQVWISDYFSYIRTIATLTCPGGCGGEYMDNTITFPYVNTSTLANISLVEFGWDGSQGTNFPDASEGGKWRLKYVNQ